MNFPKTSGRRFGAVVASLVMASSTLLPVPATAERISNPVAVFAGIDKITGRITTFDVYVDETVQFGALQVTPKVCYSRDQQEAQKIDAFVEVDEITLDRKIRRIFSGWMFADSPALNAVEHAIYDVWLTDCKATSDVPAPEGVKAAAPAPVPNAPPPPQTSESAPAPSVSIDPNAANAGELPGSVPEEPLAVPPLEAPENIDEPPPIEGLPPMEAMPPAEPVPQIPGVQPGGVGLY
jgi:Uncharacterized protein conserved in bacteria